MKKYSFPIFMTALVAMPIVAVAVFTIAGSFRVEELKILGQAPTFSLIERSGKPVLSDELKQKVWVASFVFTRCSEQCPMLCEKLKRVQNKLRFKDKFRLVSFSIDPERDTPESLSEFAKKFNADPYKWLFVTGSKREIESIVRDGFHLMSGKEENSLTHSFKLVLIDGWGRIRGYYDGLDDSAVTQLIKDARGLIRQAF